MIRPHREHTPQSGPPYHFETSEKYVSEARVIAALQRTRGTQCWPAKDLEQLEAIVGLELLRGRLAREEISFTDYRVELEHEVEAFSSRTGRHVFDDSQVHEMFYQHLNES